VASLKQCIARPGQTRARGDDGVVLVLWVLCLAALVAFLAAGLDLGNLGQGVVNAQDAADSAVLGAAGRLGPELPLSVYPSVGACDGGGPWGGSGLGDCPCPRDLSLGCRDGDYSWLNGYYIYVQDQGWLRIPEEISGEQAFAYGLQPHWANGEWSPGWSCSMSLSYRHHGPWPTPSRPRRAGTGPETCLEVSTNVTGSGPGALTDDRTVHELTSAVQYAESLAQTYYPSGQGADWSSCASPPVGFSIAQRGDKCIGYEASSDAYGYWAPASSDEYLLFWVQVVSPASSPLGNVPSEITREAYAVWAPSSTGGQGRAPWAPFGPSRLPGLAHLCSPAAGTCQ
jgi:hypothetical protein